MEQSEGEQSDAAGERDESRGEKPKGKQQISGWDPKWVEKIAGSTHGSTTL